MARQARAREPCYVATAMQVVCYASIDSKPYTHFDPGPPSWLQGVKRTALQLVSIACFLIASKHEEVCPWPHIIFPLQRTTYVPLQSSCFLSALECSPLTEYCLCNRSGPRLYTRYQH